MMDQEELISKTPIPANDELHLSAETLILDAFISDSNMAKETLLRMQATVDQNVSNTSFIVDELEQPPHPNVKILQRLREFYTFPNSAAPEACWKDLSIFLNENMSEILQHQNFREGWEATLGIWILMLSIPLNVVGENVDQEMLKKTQKLKQSLIFGKSDCSNAIHSTQLGMLGELQTKYVSLGRSFNKVLADWELQKALDQQSLTQKKSEISMLKQEIKNLRSNFLQNIEILGDTQSSKFTYNLTYLESHGLLKGLTNRDPAGIINLLQQKLQELDQLLQTERQQAAKNTSSELKERQSLQQRINELEAQLYQSKASSSLDKISHDKLTSLENTVKTIEQERNALLSKLQSRDSEFETQILQLRAIFDIEREQIKSNLKQTEEKWKSAYDELKAQYTALLKQCNNGEVNLEDYRDSPSIWQRNGSKDFFRKEQEQWQNCFNAKPPHQKCCSAGQSTRSQSMLRSQNTDKPIFNLWKPGQSNNQPGYAQLDSGDEILPARLSPHNYDRAGSTCFQRQYLVDDWADFSKDFDINHKHEKRGSDQYSRTRSVHMNPDDSLSKLSKCIAQELNRNRQAVDINIMVRNTTNGVTNISTSNLDQRQTQAFLPEAPDGNEKLSPDLYKQMLKLESRNYKLQQHLRREKSLAKSKESFYKGLLEKTQEDMAETVKKYQYTVVCLKNIFDQRLQEQNFGVNQVMHDLQNALTKEIPLQTPHTCPQEAWDATTTLSSQPTPVENASSPSPVTKKDNGQKFCH